MIKASFNDAMSVVRSNKLSRDYPGINSDRCVDGSLYPIIKPKFMFGKSTDNTVFTIGSCFARNIEEALIGQNFQIPTMKLSVPKTEWPFRANGILNEYTPGAIRQRIMMALIGSLPPVDTIVSLKDGYVDLLCPKEAFPVTMARALERRHEIAEIYQGLLKSSLVIITLGYVESWFDQRCGLYLNRMPPHIICKSQPNRYSFHCLDAEDSFSLLSEPMGMLNKIGIKVIITVSPVPLQTTFTDSDGILANEYSKSVLRVCAGKLAKAFANVDYYPSYEIVRSGGLSNYNEDRVHVKDSIVRKITNRMVSSYFSD